MEAQNFMIATGISLGSRSNLCEAKDRGFGGFHWGNSGKSWTIHVIDLSPLTWAGKVLWKKEVSYVSFMKDYFAFGDFRWIGENTSFWHIWTLFCFALMTQAFFNWMPLGHGRSRTGDRIGTRLKPWNISLNMGYRHFHWCIFMTTICLVSNWRSQPQTVLIQRENDRVPCECLAKSKLSKLFF